MSRNGSSIRVLLAPSAYSPHVGGIEELTRQLARRLRVNGHEVLVVTNRWPQPVPASDVLDGVPVRRIVLELPSASLRGLVRFAVRGPLAAVRLLRVLRAFRPDVVHVIGAGPNAAYLSVLGRGRLVFTAQGEVGFDPGDVFAHSLVLRAGLRRILRRADVVTACSRYVLDELGADGVVVPNAVEPSDFDLPKPEPNGLGRYVFAHARLVPQKGLDVLVRAVAGLGRNLVLAGDGPERDRLDKLARELDVPLRFLGAVGRDDVSRLLRGADAFALPSRGEPFGIALLEAMAAGTPAVATDAGGVPEFAADSRNALLVPPDDVPALRAALTRLRDEPALCEQLVRGGRETARVLSWEHVCSRYEELYAP